ncbi:four-carbon acid sugar kinase family protein [Pusillimonas sp. MFBS29]|uniref:four-carbon acid sugar kinase family protein n=1 Tax=Pusillimonas sp. MFBS29 TaxID=2886690 RepID=UPI001D0F53D1|nr:four-carbon acid sugar kinase family protein [Pusillimonas sp. MFBS29]MCC2597087.1 four-carbon acid sugar kinase family protein [Pusillimonas sp. MFBS29]
MAPHPTRLAFYADDFTGATDTLSTVARAGYRSMLFLRLPTRRQLQEAGSLDCLGIAGAARSMNGPEQVAELEPVGHFLQEVNASVTHYKTCSTFDSSPDTGSIGLAVQTLRKQLQPARFVPIVGGQPNLGRYCVFGNLFAAFQTGGAAYRLDRHPTMSQHPVTPMHEADLRRHLAQQGLEQIGLMEYPAYARAPAEFQALLDQAIEDHSDGILFDVGQPEHLATIGQAMWQQAHKHKLLAVGPSSVAQALIAHWTESGEGITLARTESMKTAQGPVFVMSGSRSPVTAMQIAAATSYERIPMDAGLLCAGEGNAYDALLEQVAAGLIQGRHVLAHVADESQDSSPVSAVALAQACGRFLAQVLVQGRPARIGVAGGDTSSLALKSLDVWGLSYVGQLDPGAALCRMHSDLEYLSGVELMLKGGQMGSEQVFEKLIAPDLAC